MNTKIILVGGYPRKAADGGKAFCEELVVGFPEPVNILDCLFARPVENWAKAYGEDKEFFERHLPGKKLEVVLAQPETFIDQLEWAQAIYIRGGETVRLLKILATQPDWTKRLSDKTLAGSSAGAEALSQYFYYLETLTMKEGLGLLPIKLIPHYRSDYNAPNIDWDQADTDLENYKEPLPIIKLAEGEFVVRGI